MQITLNSVPMNQPILGFLLKESEGAFDWLRTHAWQAYTDYESDTFTTTLRSRVWVEHCLEWIFQRPRVHPLRVMLFYQLESTSDHNTFTL